MARRRKKQISVEEFGETLEPVSKDDPLEQVKYDDTLVHGHPDTWTYLGHKKGSPATTTSSRTLPYMRILKVMELYKNEHGKVIELHYFRNPDGSVNRVTVIP